MFHVMIANSESTSAHFLVCTVRADEVQVQFDFAQLLSKVGNCKYIHLEVISFLFLRCHVLKDGHEI